MNLKDVVLVFAKGLALAIIILFMNARAIRLFKEDHMIDQCRTYNEKIPVYISYCDNTTCMASIFNKDNYNLIERSAVEKETTLCKE